MKHYYISIIIAFSLFLSCNGHNHNHDHEHEHEHQHEHEYQHEHGESCSDGHSHDSESENSGDKLILTSYIDNYELFAEASPLTVGKESSMLLHVTDTKVFKPATESISEIAIEVAGSLVTHSQLSTVKQGVFKATIKPSKEGDGFLLVSLNNGQDKFNVPIKVAKNINEAEKIAHHNTPSSIDGIVFTKEQSWKIDFATQEVKAHPFGQVIKTAAQILATQDDARVITAHSSGVLMFSSYDVVDGKAVSGGEVIFKIVSTDMTENNISVKYKEALNNFTFAKTEYDRKLLLAKDNIVSTSELHKARNEYQSSRNIYENIKKNYSNGGLNLSCPISGYIQNISVKNGEYVEAGQAIATISKNKNLLIKAEINSRYYSVMNKIKTANILDVSVNKTYTLEELDGAFVSYGRSISAENPLIPVFFKISNSANFVPGSFIDLYIITETSQEALTVSKEAIVEEMGNYFVFKQITPELFEKTSVKLGGTDGKLTEVISGIKEGDRVVSRGAILVKLAQGAGALDPHAGHAH